MTRMKWSGKHPNLGDLIARVWMRRDAEMRRHPSTSSKPLKTIVSTPETGEISPVLAPSVGKRRRLRLEFAAKAGTK